MSAEHDGFDLYSDARLFGSDYSNEDPFKKSTNFHAFEPQYGYPWTQNLIGFVKRLWSQYFVQSELKTEMSILAYKSMEHIAQIALHPSEKSVYRKEMKCEEDVKKREIAFCEVLWNYTVSLAHSIPATPKETEKMIGFVNQCAKESFCEQVTPEEFQVDPQHKVREDLGQRVSIEELEKNHIVTMPSGEKIPFGYINGQWMDLKIFIRDTDELWADEGEDQNWEDLAGRAEIFLVRDGYVIGKILTRIS